MESYFYIFILLLINVDTSATFLVHRPSDDDIGDTQTHFDITRAGLMRAINKYIVERKNTTSFSEFFGAGKVYLIACFSVIIYYY